MLRQGTGTNRYVLFEISMEFSNLALGCGLADSQCPCHNLGIETHREEK